VTRSAGALRSSAADVTLPPFRDDALDDQRDEISTIGMPQVVLCPTKKRGIRHEVVGTKYPTWSMPCQPEPRRGGAQLNLEVHGVKCAS
jgi:hypothetical protein